MCTGMGRLIAHSAAMNGQTREEDAVMGGGSPPKVPHFSWMDAASAESGRPTTSTGLQFR